MLNPQIKTNNYNKRIACLTLYIYVNNLAGFVVHHFKLFSVKNLGSFLIVVGSGVPRIPYPNSVPVIRGCAS